MTGLCWLVTWGECRRVWPPMVRAGAGDQESPSVTTLGSQSPQAGGSGHWESRLIRHLGTLSVMKQRLVTSWSVDLEQSIFIFLGQTALRERSKSNPALREHSESIKALKSESYHRSLKYCVLFFHCEHKNVYFLDANHTLLFLLWMNIWLKIKHLWNLNPPSPSASSAQVRFWSLSQRQDTPESVFQCKQKQPYILEQAKLAVLMCQWCTLGARNSKLSHSVCYLHKSPDLRSVDTSDSGIICEFYELKIGENQNR